MWRSKTFEYYGEYSFFGAVTKTLRWAVLNWPFVSMLLSFSVCKYPCVCFMFLGSFVLLRARHVQFSKILHSSCLRLLNILTAFHSILTLLRTLFYGDTLSSLSIKSFARLYLMLTAFHSVLVTWVFASGVSSVFGVTCARYLRSRYFGASVHWFYSASAVLFIMFFLVVTCFTCSTRNFCLFESVFVFNYHTLLVIFETYYLFFPFFIFLPLQTYCLMF